MEITMRALFAGAAMIGALGVSSNGASAQRYYEDGQRYDRRGRGVCGEGYVSVNNRCIFDGQRRGGERRGYRHRNPAGYLDYDGWHCYAPYVTTRNGCVRAY